MHTIEAYDELWSDDNHLVWNVKFEFLNKKIQEHWESKDKIMVVVTHYEFLNCFPQYNKFLGLRGNYGYYGNGEGYFLLKEEDNTIFQKEI